ncbi:unnamed protein product [Durusdinium trenchii]|uniref:FHA domain-containing protein n=1 Tax=Durusdinium trenchii TaxID=1381693 RepID=A0ABP0JP94_9DINO
MSVQASSPKVTGEGHTAGGSAAAPSARPQAKAPNFALAWQFVSNLPGAPPGAPAPVYRAANSPNLPRAGSPPMNSGVRSPRAVSPPMSKSLCSPGIGRLGGAAPPSNRMQLAKAPMNWRAGPPGGSPSGPGGLGPVSAAEWSSSPRAHSPLVVRIPSPHAKEHHVLNPTPRMVMTKHPSQSQIGPHREQVRWSHVGRQLSPRTQPVRQGSPPGVLSRASPQQGAQAPPPSDMYEMQLPPQAPQAFQAKHPHIIQAHVPQVPQAPQVAPQVQQVPQAAPHPSQAMQHPMQLLQAPQAVESLPHVQVTTLARIAGDPLQAQLLENNLVVRKASSDATQVPSRRASNGTLSPVQSPVLTTRGVATSESPHPGTEGGKSSAATQPLWALHVEVPGTARSLLHEWEAGCELPATQRVGLLFQKDFFTSVLGEEASLVDREQFQIWAVQSVGSTNRSCSFFFTNFSSNGTMVNDQLLSIGGEQVPLKDGDRIALQREGEQGDTRTTLLEFRFDLRGSILKDLAAWLLPARHVAPFSNANAAPTMAHLPGSMAEPAPPTPREAMPMPAPSKEEEEDLSEDKTSMVRSLEAVSFLGVQMLPLFSLELGGQGLRADARKEDLCIIHGPPAPKSEGGAVQGSCLPLLLGRSQQRSFWQRRAQTSIARKCTEKVEHPMNKSYFILRLLVTRASLLVASASPLVTRSY